MNSIKPTQCGLITSRRARHGSVTRQSGFHIQISIDPAQLAEEQEFPTERACLTLLFATLMTASTHWRGVPMTPAMMRQLQTLREAMADASGREAVA